MNEQIPTTAGACDPELETLVHKMLQEQLALGDSISSTALFLRFVLDIVNENLGTIRTQLETIRDLAIDLDEVDHAS
ncbi:MAG: hypothetical protein AB7V55_00360 [Oscillospiraceae bacterium]